MSSEYRNICDICKKETKGFSDDSWDKDIAKNNFDIYVSNNWLEDDKDDNGLLEWKCPREFSKHACADCAKQAADLLNKWVAENEKKS